MLVVDLLRAARRAWYVVVVGVLLTGLALVGVYRDDGLYYSQVEVRLLAPSSAAFPNVLTTTSGDIIQTAGIVAALVNGTDPPRKLADAAATLPGRGVTEGWSVTLPDTGGQWAPNFASQLLNVQVVGPSEKGVIAEREHILAEVSRTLLDLQTEAGVDPVAQITTYIEEDPAVFYMEGRPSRALLVTAALGGLTTMWSVLVWEQLRKGRTQRGHDDQGERRVRRLDPATHS